MLLSLERAAGLEPVNTCSGGKCLTAWRRPHSVCHTYYTVSQSGASTFFEIFRYTFSTYRSGIPISPAYPSYPLGFFDCQFQLSRHMSSMSLVAFQPSSPLAFSQPA